MKTGLRISISLNIVLIACLALVSVVPHVRSPAKMITIVTTNIENEVVHTAPTSGPAVRRWADWDTGNNHELVRNLRAGGCPEPIIRAVITAKVDPAYQKRNAELEQQLSAFDDASWSAKLKAQQARQDMITELQRLPEKETDEINDLLGIAPGSHSNPILASSSASPQAIRGVNWRNRQPSLPLVMQSPELSSLNLNADQQAAIAELRAHFIESVGGPNQDPNDPSYLERWQKAQPGADNELRGVLGTRLFQEYQMLAAESATVPAAP